MRKTVMAILALLLAIPVLNGTAFAERIQKGQSAAKDMAVRSQVETAVSMLQVVYRKSLNGELTLDQAKRLGADLLRDLGYGKEGYFWADTSDGVNVVLGWKKVIEGTNRIDDRDPNGVYYVRKFLAEGKAGGGYVNYLFHRKNEQPWVRKRGYVKPFEPFGWVIGTGYYLDDKDL